MELSAQCCSLVQAKRLKELGVDGNSLFIHVDMSTIDFAGSDKHFICQRDLIGDSISSTSEFDKKQISESTFSAFTTAELGIALPDLITGEYLYSYQQRRANLDKAKANHDISYWCVGKIFLHTVKRNNEAEARAEMLIYLLENNYQTAEQVNQRLNP